MMNKIFIITIVHTLLCGWWEDVYEWKKTKKKKKLIIKKNVSSLLLAGYSTLSIRVNPNENKKRKYTRSRDGENEKGWE